MDARYLVTRGGFFGYPCETLQRAKEVATFLAHTYKHARIEAYDLKNGKRLFFYPGQPR